VNTEEMGLERLLPSIRLLTKLTLGVTNVTVEVLVSKEFASRSEAKGAKGALEGLGPLVFGQMNQLVTFES
jgi:hypothetical protein